MTAITDHITAALHMTRAGPPTLDSWHQLSMALRGASSDEVHLAVLKYSTDLLDTTRKAIEVQLRFSAVETIGINLQ